MTPLAQRNPQAFGVLVTLCGVMIFVPDALLPKKLRDYDPGVVCYSTMTGIHTAHAGLNRIVKKILPQATARKLTLSGVFPADDRWPTEGAYTLSVTKP